MIVAARLLRPLGNPQPNSVKYYAVAEVLELAKDRTWLPKPHRCSGKAMASRVERGVHAASSSTTPSASTPQTVGQGEAA